MTKIAVGALVSNNIRNETNRELNKRTHVTYDLIAEVEENLQQQVRMVVDEVQERLLRECLERPSHDETS